MTDPVGIIIDFLLKQRSSRRSRILWALAFTALFAVIALLLRTR
jgi:hypothetical protein